MIIQIPFHEMDFSYARSGGPGGQNVNKTNSAAILRWNLESSQVFNEDQKARLRMKLQGKLTKDGDLLIRSDVHRDQDQNRSECIRRLQETLQRALHVPKKRVATKPTKSSQRKRVETKKLRSETKSLRQKIRG
ncbi:alternative ribosome rescue aminoacyl-tRNA hydrolase ArfB [Bdellovibrio bacteriovorus]|nr:alternative ribosome rescue aminoacyl-tRNA hydrolase ArfB [Bdellovibrio bacteriovorus]